MLAARPDYVVQSARLLPITQQGVLRLQLRYARIGIHATRSTNPRAPVVDPRGPLDHQMTGYVRLLRQSEFEAGSNRNTGVQVPLRHQFAGGFAADRIARWRVGRTWNRR